MVMTACGFLTQEIVHFCFSVIATIVVSAVFMISYILILVICIFPPFLSSTFLSLNRPKNSKHAKNA